MARPKIAITPDTYRFPSKIQVFGDGWGPCPVRFLLGDERPLRPVRVLEGHANRDAVEPVKGSFCVLFTIPGLKPGTHNITAVSERRGERFEASARFSVAERPETEKDGRPTDRWFRRREHFTRQRFPDGINRLPGNLLRALEHRDRMRLDPDRTSPPVDPGCNWRCIGPSVVRRGQVFGAAAGSYTTAPISGRITSIAYDPNDTNVVYVAAAQGGVWKSTDGGSNWLPKSDFAVSLATGCVTVDPSVTDADGRSTRIFAGTGEPNNSDSYYGMGVLFSDDGGDTWTARGTADFTRDAFSTIAVDPADNQHLYAATDVGVYESTDEGVNWNLIEAGICHDLVVDWAHPGGPELYVGRQGFGVRRSQDGGSTWATLGGGLPAALGRIALAMAPGDSNVLYAAFANGASGITGIFRTADGGTNWTPTAATPAGVGQSAYNLVLGVSPASTQTVLFGEVHLWRTTNGGGAWTRVSTGTPGIHADQHAVEFHPTNGNLVFVGNDGGVFYSTDGGQTYTHRNKDLATLQYYGIFQHPQWDAVILGGTQDNGAQRYSGHPAWEHSALGDGAFAAINSTTDTRRWYETRWWAFPCFRNDSAGAAGGWATRQTGITVNSNWFYPPLEMDPSNSAVLYCGYDKLYRTADHANNWAAITGSLVGTGVNITAIAVAPSDSNTVYVGMQDGKVFRVSFSGGSWSATDITGTPLPAGQISDIAVHPTDPNTLYATTSNLIFSEGIGEFSNDHVFRYDGTNWNNASTGLSQANPVNTVVIDPAHPDTVFIGADVGVFRSDTAGASWNAWDEGLPNCSIQDLKFFAPSRLLRAATHGRSVWERPVDAATCPLVDVYMRDDFVDTGLTTPTPSGVDHPFIAGDTVHWYQSVDLKVDSPDPVTNSYQSSGTDIDYVEFEELDHDNPRRETFVRVFAQVHNRGNNPATNVKVRAFWANASGGLPNLPTDFWTAFPNADPADTSVWHPVGPTRTISAIQPGQPKVAFWSWQVPATAPTHSCMLCVVKSDEDAIATSSLAISTAVRNDNNVTLKNLHVDNVVVGATGMDESGPHFIDFAHYEKRRPFDLRFNPGTLPKGALVYFFFPRFETIRPLREAAVGLETTTRHEFRLPSRPEEECGEPTRYDAERAFVLKVDAYHREQLPGLYGIVPEGRKFSAAFVVQFPSASWKEGERRTFHIEHWIENQHIGGSSYEFRARAAKPKAPKGRVSSKSKKSKASRKRT